MDSRQIKKLVIAAMFVAVGVVLSPFHIPIAGSKCFPIQHMVNIITGVFLGPLYSVGAAFATSLIRNLMGTGSLLAFPGSMVGAFFCGMIYKKTKNLVWSYMGEVLGTGLIGGLLAYPIAVYFLGSQGVAFMFVIPFFISTFGGSLVAGTLIAFMSNLGILNKLIKEVEK